MHFFKSIRFRLTVWYLLVIAVLLACFGTVAYALLSYQLHRNTDDALRNRAVEFESGLRIEQGQLITSGPVSDLILVYNSNGTLLRRLGPSVITFASVNDLVRLTLLGQSSFITEQALEGPEVRLYAAPFTIDSDARVAIIVGKPTTETEQVLATVRSIFLASGFLAIALAAFVGVVLTNRALFPVLRITGAADAIGEANLNRRIEVHSQDEVGRLATTLNRMMERLEAAFNRQRQFASDASHELRTPLSVIQAESTLALGKERTAEEYRKSLEVVGQEVEYMTTVLGNLLIMARSESGKEPLHLESVNLRQLLAELSATTHTLAEDKGVEFSSEHLEDADVEGDPVKLKQMFLNILQNAVAYTPKGGSVSLSMARKSGFAVVNVTDTGIGIPEEHLPLIFDRFYRVDNSRSRSQGGAGLGLAIAKNVAEVHGGRIEARSRLGKGSTFTVFLPTTGAG